MTTFYFGFETGDPGGFTDGDGTTQNSVVYGGTYAGQFTDNQYLIKTISATNNIYFGGYWKRSNWSVSDEFILLGMVGATGSIMVKTDEGKLKVLITGNSQSYSGTTLLTTGDWHRIEVFFNIHDTTGSFELKLDGTTEILQTDIDTKIGAETGLDSIRWQGTNTATTAYLDNVYIDTNWGNPDATEYNSITKGPFFGSDTIGTSYSSVGMWNYGALFTCSNNGTLTHISVNIDPSATTDKIKVAIYDSSKNLLSSGELNPVGSSIKQFFKIPVTNILLTKGTDYYLAVAATDVNDSTSATTQLWYVDGTGDRIWSAYATDTVYANLWEDPWTNEGSGTGRVYSVYGSYETTTSTSTTSTSSSSTSTSTTSTSTTSTSSSTTSTSSSTTSTSSSTISTSSSTSSTTSTSTSTTVPYLKFSVNKEEMVISENSEVLQLMVISENSEVLQLNVEIVK